MVMIKTWAKLDTSWAMKEFVMKWLLTVKDWNEKWHVSITNEIVAYHYAHFLPAKCGAEWWAGGEMTILFTLIRTASDVLRATLRR